MGIRGEFQKRIEKKQQEIKELESKIKEANSYLQALLDSMKWLPRDEGDLVGSQTLRPGTALAKAQDAIRKSGRAMHVADILKAIGKPTDKKNRVSLGGSLSGYVRRREIFTRPAPNTFGLIEMIKSSNGSEETEGSDLPENFGADN
jgi:hypothetical protein